MTSEDPIPLHQDPMQNWIGVAHSGGGGGGSGCNRFTVTTNTRNRIHLSPAIITLLLLGVMSIIACSCI